MCTDRGKQGGAQQTRNFCFKLSIKDHISGDKESEELEPLLPTQTEGPNITIYGILLRYCNDTVLSN